MLEKGFTFYYRFMNSPVNSINQLLSLNRVPINDEVLSSVPDTEMCELRASFPASCLFQGYLLAS